MKQKSSVISGHANTTSAPLVETHRSFADVLCELDAETRVLEGTFRELISAAGHTGNAISPTINQEPPLRSTDISRGKNRASAIQPIRRRIELILSGLAVIDSPLQAKGEPEARSAGGSERFLNPFDLDRGSK